MTREIGNYLELTLETVNRLFSKFQRDSLIGVRQRGDRVSQRRAPARNRRLRIGVRVTWSSSRSVPPRTAGRILLGSFRPQLRVVGRRAMARREAGDPSTGGPTAAALAQHTARLHRHTRTGRCSTRAPCSSLRAAAWICRACRGSGQIRSHRVLLRCLDDFLMGVGSRGVTGIHTHAGRRLLQDAEMAPGRLLTLAACWDGETA
jgi:hypothetical protein